MKPSTLFFLALLGLPTGTLCRSPPHGLRSGRKTQHHSHITTARTTLDHKRATQHVEANSTSPYFITGRDGVFPRLEIRDLQSTQPEQFTLFILGLQRIMQPGYEPSPASFLSLGGIHGLPYERWSGDPNYPSTTSKSRDYGGYCQHVSVLFPTWHRPLTLAVEQSVGEAATAIAGELTQNFPAEQEKWATAAKQLRFPFWDWTDSSTGVEGIPFILRPQQLQLQAPGNQTMQVDSNPLATFPFGNTRPDGFQDLANTNDAEWTPFRPGETGYFREWQQSYRWPTSAVQPQEQYDVLNSLLTGNYSGNDTPSSQYTWQSLTSNVAHLFTFPPSTQSNEYPLIWDEFSNRGMQSEASWKSYYAGSIEAPHDFVHLLVGGLGHMSNNDYAGFDPIFYLHHSNVDRIMSLWQYVYPDYWMGNGYTDAQGNHESFTQQGGTFVEQPNMQIDETTILAPFRKADNTYWTSADFRSTTPGYTYQLNYDNTTIDTSQPATADQRSAYIGTLQRYFGLDVKKTRNQSAVMKFPLFSSANTTSAPPAGHVQVDNYRHFRIGVEMAEHAFSGSYRMDIVYDNREVLGSVAVFARGLSGCASCQARREVGHKVQGFISIPNEVVVEVLGNISITLQIDLTTDVLVRTLTDSLSARLVGPSGAILATTDLEGNSNPTESTSTPLPAERSPTVTLLSAAASQVQGQEDGHYLFFDWKEHATLFDSKWTRTVPN